MEKGRQRERKNELSKRTTVNIAEIKWNETSVGESHPHISSN